MSTENLPNNQNMSQQPKGMQEGDFSELADYTLMEIATNPKVNESDAENARREIEWRKQNGEFNESKDKGDLWRDMTAHGYAYKDGKILYPTTEYRAWLASDRSTEHPQKLHETMAERIAAEESIQNNDELVDSFSNTEPSTEANIDNIDGTPYKLRNPNRIGKKAMATIDWKERNRHYHDKQRELLKNQYNRERDKLRLDAEARKHVPEVLSPGERYSKAVDSLKSFLKKPGSAQACYTEGALDHIAEGDFSLDPRFMYEGLKRIKGPKVEKIAGQVQAPELWNAIRCGDEDILPKFTSPEQLTNAEREAIRAAIEIGAYRDNQGITDKGDIKYTLPGIGNLDGDTGQLAQTLKSYNLALRQPGDKVTDILENEPLYDSYEMGFVGILDLLKDGDLDGRKDEFAAAEWYYGHLHGIKNEDEISDSVLNRYIESESEEFIAKYQEFIKWHKTQTGEIEDSESAQESEKDRLIIDFLKNNADVIDLGDLAQPIFPDLGDNDEDKSVRGGKVNKRTGYGRRKQEAFQYNVEKFLDGEIPGFSHDPSWIKLSKPFYTKPYYRQEYDDNGVKHNVVDHYEMVGAYVDEQNQVYRSSKTHNEIQSNNVRQYVTAEFDITNESGKTEHFFIAEGVTDQASAIYISYGDDARQNQTNYGFTIEDVGDQTKRFYHTTNDPMFQPMWDKIYDFIRAHSA